MSTFTVYVKDKDKYGIEKDSNGNLVLSDLVTKSFQESNKLFIVSSDNKEHLLCEDLGSMYSAETYERNRKHTEKEYLAIIKRGFKLGKRLIIDLDIDDCELDCFDYRLLNPERISEEEYFNLLEGYWDEVYSLIQSATVYTDNGFYKFYNSSAIYCNTFSTKNKGDKPNDINEHLVFISTVLGHSSSIKVDEVGTKLMTPKLHALSDLHIITKYLKENLEHLPEDVQEAYSKCEFRLDIISDKYKNLKVYK